MADPSLHQQDDHATDEEKLASSTSNKWAALHDMDADVDCDQQDFPQPCDLSSFVNENSLSHQTPGESLLQSDFLIPLCTSSCVQTNANTDLSIPDKGGAESKFKGYV